MEFKRRSKSGLKTGLTPVPSLSVQPLHHAPAAAALIPAKTRVVQRFLNRPTVMQQRATHPVLLAASLQRAEEDRLNQERQAVQAELQVHRAPSGAVEAALQRLEKPNREVPSRPTSPADWVVVMRAQAQQVEGRWLGSPEMESFKALQRQVTNALVQGYKQSRQPPDMRYAEYGQHLAELHSSPAGSQVSRAVLGMVPTGERPVLQRAVDDALQREQLQRNQDEAAVRLHQLQRQVAELDEQATRPVFERIQARRGAGRPLPLAVQRHLEQGLNQDLSAVRIHDDPEADVLSKGVNALAFTAGQDVFFRAGQFNPNSQSGMELLAHEVTHTVQQSKGQVGPGIDPDAGLEQEARTMGRRLARQPLVKPVSAISQGTIASPHSMALTTGLAVQRQAGMFDPTTQTFAKLGAQTGGNLLGGSGQAWSDASSAAQMALQALPGRLGQQFQGIPAELLNGLLAMLRDSALVLAATTTLGAAIGAFFAGGGAVLGATIGAEMGQAILTAWGLGAIIVTVTKQIGVLGASAQSYLNIVRSANGNPQRVKAASEALTSGLVIFADAVILAVAALVLKGGVQAIAKSRIGQQIGAKTASSPSVQWLRARQRMTTTRQVAGPAVQAAVARGTALGKTLLARTDALLRQGKKMASAVQKGIEKPTDPALLAEAVRVGTLKYQLHPEYPRVKAEIEGFGFQIKDKPGEAHVDYVRYLKDKQNVESIEKTLWIDPEARFLDLQHELGHIRQLMVNLKGQVYVRTGIQKPTGFKDFEQDPLYRGTTLSRKQDVVTELHERLSEYLRLAQNKAGAELLAEHQVTVDTWLKRYWDETNTARGSAKAAELKKWALENFPDLTSLIERYNSATGK